MCHVFVLVIGLTLNMASIVYTHQLLVSTSQCICTCLGGTLDIHLVFFLYIQTVVVVLL